MTVLMQAPATEAKTQQAIMLMEEIHKVLLLTTVIVVQTITEQIAQQEMLPEQPVQTIGMRSRQIIKLQK